MPDCSHPQPGDTFPQLTTDEVAQLRQRQLTARLMRLVAVNAYAAYMNSLGRDGSAYERQSERTRHPQPGDVVLETSTVYRWARDADDTPADSFPALGVLLRTVDEPCVTAEELDEMHREKDYFVSLEETLADIPKEKFVYIAPLDGSMPEYRWANASFIRVLSSMKDIHPDR